MYEVIFKIYVCIFKAAYIKKPAIPININSVPAIIDTNFLFIFVVINFPRYIAIIDMAVKAAITPIRTRTGLN